MLYKEDVKKLSVHEIQTLCLKGESFALSNGEVAIGDGCSGSYIKLKGYPTRISVTTLLSKMAYKVPRKNPQVATRFVEQVVQEDIAKIAINYHKKMTHLTMCDFVKNQKITPSMVRYMSKDILMDANIIGVSNDGRRILVQDGDKILRKTFVHHTLRNAKK